MVQNIYMLPSNIKLRQVLSGTIIKFVSDEKFSLGKNDEVNLAVPAMKSHKTNSLETPDIKNHKTNSLETSTIKSHKTNSLETPAMKSTHMKEHLT